MTRRPDVGREFLQRWHVPGGELLMMAPGGRGDRFTLPAEWTLHRCHMCSSAIISYSPRPHLDSKTHLLVFSAYGVLMGSEK